MAPFELITFDDARKRGRQIVQVTGDRYMPPFLPEPGPVPFSNARHLSAEQRGLIRQWVDEGAIEGSAADLPPKPNWTQGWQLGPPDQVVKMPQPFTVDLSKSAWSAPVSHDPVTIGFHQPIAANEPLRTGNYSATVTFTLSTTTP